MTATLLPLPAAAAAAAAVAHVLTETDIALARTACMRLPGAWSAAAELDYAGRLAVILMPAGDDDAAPSFHLAGEDDAVALGACRWDRFTALGRFPTMRAALDAVAHHLAA